MSTSPLDPAAPSPLHLPGANLAAAANTPLTDREQTTEQALRDARPQQRPDEAARERQISDDVRARLFGGSAPPREPVAAAPAPRAFIGRFERRGQISFGGMGVVDRCLDPLLHREVAIKLRRPDRPDTEHDYERLLNEARALGVLAHDNVVRVYEAGKLEGRQLYVVLEYVAGPTLTTWLERPRSFKQILDVFLQAGEGLAAAHACNLLHRDIKPSNIIVRTDGRVKLIDFGLAKTLGSDDLDAEPDPGLADAPTPELYDLTEHGHILGTRGFLAPELFFGARPSVASDIFAFCTTLYWALYRRYAFAGGRAPEAVRQFTRPSHDTTAPGRASATAIDPPRSLEEVLGRFVEPRAGEAGAPRRIAKVLRKGLAAHPADRHASMAELLADLRRQPYLRPLQAGMLALTVASVGASVYFEVQRAAASEPCAAVGAEIDAVWSPERRAAVEAAFVATAAPNAAASFAATAAQIDAYTRAWSDARGLACTAAIGNDDPAAALQRACLERGKQQLDATVARLADADAATVLAAPELLAVLPAPDACNNTLLADQACHAPITDAPTRELADEMQRALTASRAAYITGDLAGAIDAAAVAVRRADATGRKGLIAEALLAHGDALYAGGRVDEAAAALLAARDAAQQIACADVLVDAYSRLDKLAALEQTAPLSLAMDRTATQINLALALGSAHARVADAHNDRGLVLEHLAHRHEDAEAAFLRAIEVRSGLGEDDPLHALALADSYLNASVAAAGQVPRALHHARAMKSLERSIALRTAALGVGHPSLYKHEMLLAYLLTADGELAAAREHYARARALAGGYGERSREVVRVEVARAALEYASSDLDAALEHARAALEIVETTDLQADLGPNALDTVAKLLIADGDLDRAIVLLERSLLLHAATPEPDRRARGDTLILLADAYNQSGRPREALRHAARASEDLQAAPQRLDSDLARASLIHGEALLSLAQPVDGAPFMMAPGVARAAREALQRTVEISQARDDNPALLAWARWDLARVVCEGQGERREGRRVAEAALAYFTTSAGESDNQQTADAITAWLGDTCKQS